MSRNRDVYYYSYLKLKSGASLKYSIRTDPDGMPNKEDIEILTNHPNFESLTVFKKEITEFDWKGLLNEQ